MAGTYVIRKEGDGIDLLAGAVQALGGQSKARRAFAMALNQTGRDARVQTIRALSKQVGLSKRDLIHHGAIKEDKAKAGALEWSMRSTGRHLPLKLFGARQFSYGVSAKPWGERQKFPGAFINAGTYRSGKPVLGGHVLHRSGPKIVLDDYRMKAKWHGKVFQPFEIMYGPAVPQEMAKAESAKAFTEAAAKLPRHVERIVTQMTKGVIK